MDYITAVGNKIQTDCATLEKYLVQITCGPAQKKRRPHYCWVALDKESAKALVIPNSIDALQRRAKPREGVHMRCLDRFCSLRTVEEKQSLEVAEGKEKKPEPGCEIDAEHNEVQADDVAEEDEDDGPPEEVIVSPVCDRSCIRDLWPFAYGKEYYKAMIMGIIGSEAIAHFIYISATAHPAALLAAHELGMGVHVVLSKVRQHSTSHGKLLLRNTIFTELYAIEKKSAQHAKRVLVGDLAFVPIAAPRDQPVFFFDASPSKDGNWRVGIDSCPTSEFLERAVPKLLSRELEMLGLAIAEEKGVRRLIANRGFREEEIIGPMTALLFSEATAVVEFLNSGGNAALLVAPLLKVEGLLGQSSVKPEATASIYAIPTGVGRLLCDFRSVRKFANVAIMAFPSEGAQDGFLQIKARTHNGCGIAAGATLCCDFGERYVAASAGDIQPAKRFRGALEVFFPSRLRSTLPGPHARTATCRTARVRVRRRQSRSPLRRRRPRGKRLALRHRRPLQHRRPRLALRQRRPLQPRQPRRPLQPLQRRSLLPACQSLC